MNGVVRVTGNGIAAYAAGHLLKRGQTVVSLTPGPVRPSPVVLLSTATQILLRDVFEDPLLFENPHVIRRRVVRWGGSEAQTISVPHSGVAVTESQLLTRLAAKHNALSDELPESPAWTIACARTASEEPRRHFGTRTASSYPVTLENKADAAACYVESVQSGWLFLLPFGGNRASLLCVGAESDVLKESTLVVPQIAEIGGKISSFPAHPSILSRLAAPGIIACGAAAMTFDPLCGEGMGNSIREAILGSAVVRSALRGGDVSHLVDHFQACLRRGFLRHLEACNTFYSAGPRGEWWQAQQNQTRDGIDWIKHHPPAEPFHFRLIGFDLEAASPVSPSKE